MLINLSSIKKIKNRETIIINIGELINSNIDLVLPFRAKSLDEQIKLMSLLKGGKYTGVKKYTPYRNAPKKFKDYYENSQAKSGSHEISEIDRSRTFIIIDAEKDKKEIETRQLLERVLGVVIHLDMDYEVEVVDDEGEEIEDIKMMTMWELWSVKKGDYLDLANQFSEIITTDDFLKTLEYAVLGLKSNEANITEFVGIKKGQEAIRNMNEDEIKALIELKMMQDKMEKEVEEKNNE